MAGRSPRRPPRSLPGIGAQTLIFSFAVVTTAGLGQIEGAAVTSLLIGLGHSFAVSAAVLAVAAFVPWLRFVLTIAIARGITVLGILLLLRAGQVSFGHALYLALAAYTAAFAAPCVQEVLVLPLLGALGSGALEPSAERLVHDRHRGTLSLGKPSGFRPGRDR